jgi:hypothetical protein
VVAPATTICNPGSGDLCDPDESCTGVADAQCPADVVAPATTICNPGSGDVCDPDESCTGVADATCPNDVITPATTICRLGSGDLCDPDESCTGVADATCPDDVVASPTTICRPSVGVCDADDSCTGVPGEACPPDGKEPCAFVTDSSLCPFDVNPNKGSCVDADGNLTGEPCDPLDGDPGCNVGETCEQTGQFRLVFTPSPRDTWPAYKLNASNPGQYFYNLIVDGSPGDTVTIDVDIPYPFVTQGAMPVHVYDAIDVVFDQDGCFVPMEALQTFGQQIVIEDYIGGTMGGTLVCDQVGCGLDGAGICSFGVDVLIPDSGQAYVNVHLDYGLKGVNLDANDGTVVNPNQTVCDGSADRYDREALPDPDFGGWDALENTLTDDGPLALSNCKPYDFSHECLACSDPSVFGDQVESLNEFKRIAGGFGRVHRSNNGSGVEGAHVMLHRLSTDEIVQMGTTDEDGAYLLSYKHTGAPELYLVILTNPQMDQLVQLKGNGWAEVNFDVHTGVIDAAWAETGGGRRRKKH